MLFRFKNYQIFKFFKLSKLPFCENKAFKDINDFVNVCDHTLNDLFEQIDSKELEEIDNITYSDGVLKFSFKNNKHYVLNIQRPNLQIWLSSPISGPQRFEFHTGTEQWLNIRNKKPLNDILEEEINSYLSNDKITLL